MSNHVAATSSAASANHAQTSRAQQTKKSSGASFAELHAAAVRTAKDEDTKSTKSSASAAKPKGERTEKVDGHSYAEIVAGPRNGMFLNMSDNERSGQAFVMVKREGRQFHVYGQGDDRAVYEVGRRTSTSGTKTTSSTPATT
jgi:hypothetical protein